MAFYLADALNNLESIGLTDVLLPFILIFTIVFAVLQKTKILGEDENKKPRKNYNVIVALVMALAVVIPHVTEAYPPEKDIVNIINGALPNISLIVVAIIMLLLLVGVWGKSLNIGGSSVGGWVVIISAIVVLYIFGTEAHWFSMPSWLDFLRDPSTQATIIVILVFAIIIWFVTRDEGKSKDEKEHESFAKGLGKLLKD
jgi:Na+(H+)/acetate symporter ActP